MQWVDLFHNYNMERALEHTPAKDEEWHDLRENGERQYFLCTWYPTEGGTRVQPRAAVVFVHGFAEFIERYDWAFRYFADHGVLVSGFDQRGYGRTWYNQPHPELTHGWTTWSDQITDVGHMIRLVRARLDAAWGKDTVPIFLMGHSMGGGISSAFLTRDAGAGPSRELMGLVLGVMLSAPWLDIHFPIPSWLGSYIMTGVLALFPRIRIPLGPTANELSRDPEVVREIRRNPLHNNYVYTRGLYDPLSGGPKIVSQDYHKWPEHVPLLIAHGTGDVVTRADASETLVRHLREIGRDAEYAPFAGYYHELLYEPGDYKIKVADTYLAWLDRHLTARTQ